jgi:hypothetical protein
MNNQKECTNCQKYLTSVKCTKCKEAVCYPKKRGCSYFVSGTGYLCNKCVHRKDCDICFERRASPSFHKCKKCNHEICDQCWWKILEKKTPKCPTCRSNFETNWTLFVKPITGMSKTFTWVVDINKTWIENLEGKSWFFPGMKFINPSGGLLNLTEVIKNNEKIEDCTTLHLLTMMRGD